MLCACNAVNPPGGENRDLVAEGQDGPSMDSAHGWLRRARRIVVVNRRSILAWAISLYGVIRSGHIQFPKQNEENHWDQIE
jgi:hypothetical protein